MAELRDEGADIAAGAIRRSAATADAAELRWVEREAEKNCLKMSVLLWFSFCRGPEDYGILRRKKSRAFPTHVWWLCMCRKARHPGLKIMHLHTQNERLARHHL